jgi:ferrochelatase
MAEQSEKIAVVLFNLGGPDSLEAVKPFLTNLFSDPAIINAPAPIRWLLARFIAWHRARSARGIYDQIGGASPLLENTKDQAQLLESMLADLGQVSCFIAMRYWHPMSEATALEVKRFAPGRIVLLPLYPHFSPATSGSSFNAWSAAAAKIGLDIPTSAICCYPTHPDYVAALAQGLRDELSVLNSDTRARVLFSAHGLPKKNIAAGDPYQWQIERTAAEVVKMLGIPELDWVVCYQSRVGPLEWLGPYTEDELVRAAGDDRAVVIVPIAFVSEHSETLVELDIDYRKRAGQLGLQEYRRVPTLGIDTHFIAALAAMVRHAVSQDAGRASGVIRRICPDVMQCHLSDATGEAGE